jgi:hypothetical protein
MQIHRLGLHGAAYAQIKVRFEVRKLYCERLQVVRLPAGKCPIDLVAKGSLQWPEALFWGASQFNDL